MKILILVCEAPCRSKSYSRKKLVRNAEFPVFNYREVECVNKSFGLIDFFGLFDKKSEISIRLSQFTPVTTAVLTVV